MNYLLKLLLFPFIMILVEITKNRKQNNFARNLDKWKERGIVEELFL